MEELKDRLCAEVPSFSLQEKDKRMRWYAVYTNPRWEKKVSEILTTKNIENYCPLNTVRRRWADRWKTVTEPVFRSYVFVRISQAEQTVIKQTTGIVNFVQWLGKPAVIKDREIEEIKKFLEKHGEIKLEMMPAINDQVQIINGILEGQHGTVTEVGAKTVKLMLPSLGFHLVAEVDVGNVAVIN